MLAAAAVSGDDAISAAFMVGETTEEATVEDATTEVTEVTGL